MGQLTVEHHINAKLGKREDPNLPIEECLSHILPMKVLCGLGLASLSAETRQYHLFLAVAEVRCCGGIVCESEPGRNTQDDGGYAFNYEDPSPTVLTSNTY